MTMVDLDLDTIEQLDEPWQCEGENHKTSGFGHRAEEPASWLLIAPCCTAMRIIICESRRQFLLQTGLLWCSICAKCWTIEHWSMQNIGG